MTRTMILVAALVLAWTPFLTGAADQAEEKPVVVDALDLRTPVPDPEKELTEKYDGKLVVFTGNLHGSGRDANTNQRWYQLAVQVIQEQSKPTVKPKMQTVVVKVYFAGNERRLPARPASYTVQGTGEITVDGSLIIRNARMMAITSKTPRAAR